jgi:hypothetical protein
MPGLIDAAQSGQSGDLGRTARLAFRPAHRSPFVWLGFEGHASLKDRIGVNPQKRDKISFPSDHTYRSVQVRLRHSQPFRQEERFKLFRSVLVATAAG